MNQDFSDDALRRAGQFRGECPPPELLSVYAEGRADAEVESAIGRHVMLCGVCDLLVTRIREDDGAVPDAVPQPALDRIAATLGVSGPRPTPRLRRIFWHPAFAYTFGAVLALAVFAVPRTPPVPPPPAPVPAKTAPAPLLAAPRIDLDSTRGSAAARLSRTVSPAVLSFVIPIRPQTRYTATLIDAQGNPAGGERQVLPSEDGYFYVVTDVEGLRPGAWALAVNEYSASGGRRFVFPFTVD